MAKRKKIMQNVQVMMERGEGFGETLMGILMQVATNWKGIGIAAIGMAKAWTALKSKACDSGVNIEILHTSHKLETMRIILEPADKAEVRTLAKSLEDLGLATVFGDEQGTNGINSRVCHALELLQKEKQLCMLSIINRLKRR